jgi:IS6 family transposase
MSRSVQLILNAIAEKLKRQSKDDFKRRHFEAWLIVQAVNWYLHYPLSYRNLEEMFRARGLEVDHSTINRWVLAYAPMIEKRLHQFHRPHSGSVRIDETYVKIRGKWRFLYRAIDKHGSPIDFLLTAKRFFCTMLKDEPLFRRKKIGTDGANSRPSAIKTAVADGLLHPYPIHYGVGTRAMRNRALRANGAETDATRRSPAGRRSHRNPFGIGCSASPRCRCR